MEVPLPRVQQTGNLQPRRGMLVRRAAYRAPNPHEQQRDVPLPELLIEFN